MIPQQNLCYSVIQGSKAKFERDNGYFLYFYNKSN